jgi:hypothetical protein
MKPTKKIIRKTNKRKLRRTSKRRLRRTSKRRNFRCNKQMGGVNVTVAGFKGTPKRKEGIVEYKDIDSLPDFINMLRDISTVHSAFSHFELRMGGPHGRIIYDSKKGTPPSSEEFPRILTEIEGGENLYFVKISSKELKFKKDEGRYLTSAGTDVFDIGKSNVTESKVRPVERGPTMRTMPFAREVRGAPGVDIIFADQPELTEEEIQTQKRKEEEKKLERDQKLYEDLVARRRPVKKFDDTAEGKGIEKDKDDEL